MAEALVFAAVLEDNISPVLTKIAESLESLAVTTKEIADIMTAGFTEAQDSAMYLADRVIGVGTAITESTAAVEANSAALLENAGASRTAAGASDKAAASTSRHSAATTLLHLGLALVAIQLISVADSSVKAAIEFDTLATTIFSLSKPAGMGIADITKKAQELAIQFGITPVEVAKGMYQVYSAISDVQKANDVLVVALKGAVSAHMDTAAWTKIVTSAYIAYSDVIDQYTKKVYDASRVSDVLINMITRADVPAASITTSFSRMLTPAEATTTQLEDMAAAFATLEVQGESARQGEMLLGSTMLTVMNKPEEFAKRIKELGGTFDINTYKGKDFIDKLFMLQTAADKLHVPLNQLFSQSQQGAQAFLLMTKNGDLLREKLYEIEGTTNSTNDAWNNYTHTLKFHMGQLHAVVQSYINDFIEWARPSINNFLDGTTKKLSIFATFVETHSGQIIAGFKRIVPVLEMIGALLTITLVTTGIEKLGGALLGLTGLPKLLGALGGTKGVEKGFGGLVTLFQDLFLWGGKMASGIINGLALLAVDAGPFLATVGGAISRFFMVDLGIWIWQGVRYFEMFALNSLGFLKAFGLGVVEVFMNFPAALRTVGVFFGEIGRLLMGGLRTVIPLLVSGFLEMVTAVPALIGSLMAVLGPVLLIAGGIALLVIAFLNFRSQVMDVVTTLMGALKPTIDGVEKSFQGFLAGIQAKWNEVWPQLRPAILDMLNAAKEMVPLFQVIGKTLGVTLGIIFTVIGAVVKAFIAALPSIAGVFSALFRFLGLFGQLIQAIFTGQFGKIPQIVWGMVQQIFNFIHNGFSAVLIFVGTFIGGIIQFFVTLWHRLVGGSIVIDIVMDTLMWFGKLVIQGPIIIGQMIVAMLIKFGQLVMEGINAAIRFVTGIVNEAGKLASRLGAVITIAVMNAVSAISNGIGSAISATGNFIQGILDAAGGLKDKLGGLMNNAFSTAINMISSWAERAKKAAGDFFSGIVNGGKKILGISSPSTVMIEMGNNINEGLAQGISKSSHLATSAATDTAKKVGTAYKGTTFTGVATVGAPGTSGVFGATGNGTINLTINVEAKSGMSAGFQMLSASDRRKFATDIAREIGLSMGLQANYGAGYAAR